MKITYEGVVFDEIKDVKEAMDLYTCLKGMSRKSYHLPEMEVVNKEPKKNKKDVKKVKKNKTKKLQGRYRRSHIPVEWTKEEDNLLLNKIRAMVNHEIDRNDILSSPEFKRHTYGAIGTRISSVLFANKNQVGGYLKERAKEQGMYGISNKPKIKVYVDNEI